MTVFFPLFFAPTGAALLTQWFAERDFRIFRLYGSWKRMLLGASVGSALFILAIAVIPAVMRVEGPLRTLHWSEFISFGSLSWFTFLGGPLGEEAGWRGYALPRLQAIFGPVRASLVLGILWALWHLPLFLIPGFMSAPIPVFAVCLICSTPIMTFGANLSRFSIAAAVLMHFALNSTGGLYGGLIAGAEMRKSIPQEVVMPLSILATAAIIVTLTRGRLAARSDPSPVHLF
jgi:CAAX amino terminal protease family.